MVYTVEHRDGKWRVVNEVGQTVVTVEPTADINSDGCKSLAVLLASMMTQALMWS